METDDNKNVLALVICTATVSVFILIVQETYAISSINAVSNLDEKTHNNSEGIALGNPFYVEHYNDVAGKPEIINKSFTSSFTGKGIINGTLNVNAEGNAIETFRNNETVYFQGNAKFVTDIGDIASYKFEAIGGYNPDGTFEGRGVAVFDDGATGRLSSLSNTVGIYRDQIAGSGNGTFLMWPWK